MAAFGWIGPDSSDWLEQIDACLEFFDVANPDIWNDKHTALTAQALFRTSRSIDRDEYAIAAWLRQCELELSEIPCRDWDVDAFAALLPQLLPLTRVRDPREFLPELQRQCAEVGVAIGVVRAPRGCPVSGAARPLESGRPSIALSGRHLSDDHLWFTFFHEAAHVLLHGSQSVFIDEIEPGPDSPQSAPEIEADNYAGELLVPEAYKGRIAQAYRQPFKLKDIAEEIGVSPGILVGQLQHHGILGYATRLNKLKRRYRWDGSSLEMA
jgi:hypothetical protein